MDEYIRRGAAIEETCSDCTERNICGGSCSDTDRLRAIRAADVVAVVRRRDCFYNAGELRDLWGNPVILCVTAVKHEPDWYCASGKRKDGGREE